MYSSSCYRKIATNMVQFPRIHFLTGFLSPLGTTEPQSAEDLFKNLHTHNLSLASFIQLSPPENFEKPTANQDVWMEDRESERVWNNIESSLLTSSGIFRLSEPEDTSEIEMLYEDYCPNNNENSTHQAFSDMPRVNPLTKEKFASHAAITVNSHAIK
mmetsp:Transcript_39693/g.39280  ORF Transcript_39693/g.39280 Transcript_39693/m.39280 type:complete len:158 (-) Transcript_39693:137-610(-)